MAVEILNKHAYFLQSIFGIDEEKRNFNYKPQQISDHPFPRLSYSSLPLLPNYNNLMKTEKSLSYLSFSNTNPNPNPIPSPQMSEDPVKIARSVAAAFLLKRFHERIDPNNPDQLLSFIPVNSEAMLACLNRLHLITPFEQEALLKSVQGGNFESEKDAMISALNSALLSIEEDTGAITCYFCRIFNGIHKPMVIVLSVQPDILAKELLPASLRFQDLALRPEHVSNYVEYERGKIENLRLRYSM